MAWNAFMNYLLRLFISHNPDILYLVLENWEMKKTLLLAALFRAFHCSAQWSMNPMINTPICTDTNKQIDMRMMEDGKGGAFITWKDYRQATYNPDVYIQ